ncbi:helix-turn-helix transcriptional regulator [Arthrobacter sp. H14-L1]|uniref:helix-turn-helix transcriptional regulator n=1 Tax=Arthrobacter sp. H14-L1 TaxID=2996697 RepID=UPI00226DB50F|nr:WYL domain-containing protein [Arthrobacter sp. H14-L1]MCY0906342.1 WYL domain-containing protein [Arthrobacter sp. H14-L1]
MNLVIALLGTKYGRSRDFLRNRINGYDPQATDDAFGRMFERDKTHLKNLGIPITSLRDPHGEGDDAWKYLIRPQDYRLPQIRLDPEGLAVLSLAARVWEQASLGSAAARAVRKLETVAPALPAASAPVIAPRMRTTEAAFDPLWEALLNHQRVSFSYRRSQDVRTVQRQVEPWGLGNKYGQWYLSGRDIRQGEQRLYRLARITSDVSIDRKATFSRPENFDMAAVLDSLGTGPLSEAVLALPAGRGQLLREMAAGHPASRPKSHSTSQPADHPASQPTETGEPAQRQGWDRVTVPYRDPELLADDLAAMGAAVVVLAPPVLRAAVLRRLQGAAAVAAGFAPAADFTRPLVPRRPKPNSEDRLRRLLDLVPFLVQNSGIEADAVAEEFGISLSELEADLALLSVCGLPGYQHGELIDVRWDEGTVFIRDADELARPLRLTQEEACALLVGLESLQSLPDDGALPDDGGDQTLRSVLESVRSVAGSDAWLADVVQARITPQASLQMLSVLQRAVTGSARVRISYFVPLRDEVTDRVIEPLRLFSLDSHWYVEAWCTLACGMRNFRLDNIRTAYPTGEAAVVHQLPVDAPLPESAFTPGAADLDVVIALDGSSQWVTEAYGAREQAILPDGRIAVRLNMGRAAAVPALMARLAGGGQVLEPADLREETAAFLAEALLGYARAVEVDGAGAGAGDTCADTDR